MKDLNSEKTENVSGGVMVACSEKLKRIRIDLTGEKFTGRELSMRIWSELRNNGYNNISFQEVNNKTKEADIGLLKIVPDEDYTGQIDVTVMDGHIQYIRGVYLD